MSHNPAEKQDLNSAAFIIEKLLQSNTAVGNQMAEDCLLTFNEFKWVPVVDISYDERSRWRELKAKGFAGQLSIPELVEFLDLTDPEQIEGEVHTFALQHYARKFVGAIRKEKELGDEDTMEQEGPKISGNIVDVSAKANQILSTVLGEEALEVLSAMGAGERFGEIADEHIFKVEATLDGALSVVVTNWEGVPELKLEVDVYKGIPSVHFNLPDDDSLLHVYATGEGILLTPEDEKADFISNSDITDPWGSKNSILLKEQVC